MDEKILTVESQDAGRRVDAYIAEKVSSLTRSMVQNLLEQGSVTLKNERQIKKNYKVIGGDQIIIQLPEVQQVEIVPQQIPIDIVYEDENIIVVNKARGMVVHPAAGNWDGTLVNALMFHCGNRLSGINGKIRPGIVHRIDKNTSGLLVVAKNDMAHQSLAAQIASHTAAREYQAIVIGAPKEQQGSICQPIGRHKTDRKKMAIVPDGRHAVTHYKVMERYCGYSRLAFQLETGRTHQIRVHMASIGHPIIGDPLYGVKKDRFHDLNGQCLHAYRLTFEHPKSGQKMVFETPLPKYFTDVLHKMVPEKY